MQMLEPFPGSTFAIYKKKPSKTIVNKSPESSHLLQIIKGHIIITQKIEDHLKITAIKYTPYSKKEKIKTTRKVNIL